MKSRFKTPFKLSQTGNQLSAESESNSMFQNLNQSQTLTQRSTADELVANREPYSSCGTRLRQVSELTAKYRPVFVYRFPVFNVIQSKVFEDVLHSDKSIALCAPTGSGKTVVFELSIIKQLIDFDNNGQALSALKVIYVAPLKKLVDEKYEEFKSSFGRFDINCLQLTGDSDIEDYMKIRDANIILTTPEKWDSMIRSTENRSLIKSIQVMLIDEIHSIGDGTRGATMEAVISRMKTLRSVELENNMSVQKLRFIAASATAPNVEDIAHWLDPYNSIGYNLSDSLRPVRLQKIVFGYQCRQEWNDFRFDINLSFKLDSLIKSHSESKPTLIFCSSRKSVEMTAETLTTKSFTNYFGNQSLKHQLLSQINAIKYNKLKKCLERGVGIHHSGLDKKDKEIVERLFTQNLIPVLISTTTLSMGVNLPAHLVIVKGTTQYVNNGCIEYPETQVLQMIGRAGRPQFDTSATAIILTKTETKSRYENLLNGTQIIESNLHKSLVEHLNAEIALQTVTTFDIAVNWIRSTFLFIRVLKNPEYYGSTVQFANVEQSLQLVRSWCRQELTGLRAAEMIVSDGEFASIAPTALGRFMARHCISLKTMKKLCEMSSKELSLNEIIEEISKCDEIRNEIQLRVNEKKILNELNQKDKKSDQPTVRFPISGRIKTADMKINCLIQSTFGSLPLHDSTLIQDSLKIMRTGQRMSRCLSDVLHFKVKQNVDTINAKTLMNAIILNKCFKAKIWHDSQQVAKQLKKIGAKMASLLVDRGLISFNDIRGADPRDIEFCLKRHPPFGRQLIDEVKRLPFYSMSIQQNMREGLKPREAMIKVLVKLTNVDHLRDKEVVIQTHSCFLIVFNDENELIFCNKLFDSYFCKNNGVFESKDIRIERKDKSEYINAFLISDSFVGLDVECKLKPEFADNGRATPEPNQSNSATAFSDISCEPNVDHKSDGCCQHKCVNKSTCGHICCKKGLNTENNRKQGTKHKHEEKSDEKRVKKSKPNTSLDDWLINYKKRNSGQKAETKATDKSVYFKDNPYSEISDNECNENEFNNDLNFNDLNDYNFDDDIDFEKSLTPKPNEPSTSVAHMDSNEEKDFFDDELDKEFDKQLDEMLSCNEDFQQFAPKTMSDSQAERVRKNRQELIDNGIEIRFEMKHWSLFLPTMDLDDKTFFYIPKDKPK